MNSLLRAAVVVVAAFSLLVAAGCGGDTESNNEYVSSINKVQTDFANSVQSSTSAPSGSDPQEAAKRTFTNLDGAITKLVADLRDIEPPDKVKRLHERLIAQMREFNGDIKKVGDALDSNDPQKIAAAQTDFATSAGSLGSEIGQTITDINTELQK
jgi:hypothetical protein